MTFRRHLIEMTLSMVLPMSAIFGIELDLETIFPVALVGMTAPMVALMYLRRDRYTHHEHHATS